MDSFVLGVDFGSDSVRALVVDASDGRVAGSAVSPYRRWREGLYSSPAEKRYRQHPLDYLEGFEEAVKAALAAAGDRARRNLRSIAVDTTASTPCLMDARGRPLALDPAFREDPDAMFILWKDHASIAEAEEIGALARSWGGEDFTRFTGGSYSPEWFWAKALRVLRTNPRVAAASSGIVEHCDWIPALLAGHGETGSIARGRAAAGHKALWQAAWGGYPPPAFFERLDPGLSILAAGLGRESVVGGTAIGELCPLWAGRLGLGPGVVVASGTVDAHTGAFGAGVRPGVLVQILGTSACSVMVSPRPGESARPIRGICGQVDGSVIGGFEGYEAGQSAFGDVLAWFRDLLLWPRENLAGSEEKVLGRDSLFSALESAAARTEPGASGLLALDWFNGRRSPDEDPARRGLITGLSLGVKAPELYRAFIESLAFGSRAIVERFREEGVVVGSVVATGGIARKSELVMQVMADVLGMRIGVPSSEETVALGAAMFAATAAGLYPDALSAQAAMASPLGKTFVPEPSRGDVYAGLYRRYLELGSRLA